MARAPSPRVAANAAHAIFDSSISDYIGDFMLKFHKIQH